MNNQFFSKFYNGFLVQQTNEGWVIPLLPERTQGARLSPGPYSTYQIACNVINRVLEDPCR